MLGCNSYTSILSYIFAIWLSWSAFPDWTTFSIRYSLRYDTWRISITFRRLGWSNKFKQLSTVHWFMSDNVIVWLREQHVCHVNLPSRILDGKVQDTSNFTLKLSSLWSASTECVYHKLISWHLYKQTKMCVALLLGCKTSLLKTEHVVVHWQRM